jgi:mono/diheme cytochrome c family protein
MKSPHFFRRASLIRLTAAAALALTCKLATQAQEPVVATAPSPALAATKSADQAPTYLGDVLPIFMGNCSSCHNQQSRFVYNWLDYKTAYRDRWEIRRRVWDSWKGSYYKEAMPIANSPESLSLSDDQRLIVKRWVDSGGAMGAAPVEGAPKPKAERLELGRHLFSSICAACHQQTGMGRPSVFPPLAGSDFLNADKSRAIRIVISGRQGEVIVNGMKYNNNMPAFPLSNQDIANVLTYVYNSFGNAGLEVTTEEVKAIRAQPYTAPAATPAPKSAFE